MGGGGGAHLAPAAINPAANLVAAANPVAAAALAVTATATVAAATCALAPLPPVAVRLPPPPVPSPPPCACSWWLLHVSRCGKKTDRNSYVNRWHDSSVP